MNHYPSSILNGRRIAYRTLSGIASGRVCAINDAYVFARTKSASALSKVFITDIVRVYN